MQTEGQVFNGRCIPSKFYLNISDLLSILICLRLLLVPDWDQNLAFKTDVIWVSKPFKIESQEPQPWNICINSGKRFLAFYQLLCCQILIIFMSKLSDIKCNWHDPEGNIRIPFGASELCSSEWPVIDFVLCFIFWGQNFFFYFSAVCIYSRLDTWCWWLRVRVWIWQWNWKEAVNFLCVLQ